MSPSPFSNIDFGNIGRRLLFLSPLNIGLLWNLSMDEWPNGCWLVFSVLRDNGSICFLSSLQSLRYTQIS